MDPHEEKLRKWHEEYDPEIPLMDPEEVLGWSFKNGGKHERI